MKALVIGATGYVGSHVAKTFAQRGYTVSGLARTPENIRSLEEQGVAPVEGSFDDLSALKRIVGGYDVVVMAAMVPFDDELSVMDALVEGCTQGDTQNLLFTSGSGVLSIESLDGRWSQYTFAEDDPFPFPARPNRAMRIQTEERVRSASTERLRTYVIRPPLIYGNGGSIQIPQIFESVRSTGHACYLGHGLNLYSAVHVEDLAEAYALAVEKGTPGALYHTVSGEANFRSIAEAVAQVTGTTTRSLDYAQACELWGKFWVDIALAVNSRSIAKRTVADLGWQPKHIDVIEDIRSGSYARKFQGGLEAYSWQSHG
ncbi:NAD-dependent epimerase/dehydratase family protein [Sphingobium sp. JS3065]|uniref:NAD-dependent epimerase/dehydratase family protein n=1 Tax=Sphingobium sp. JS3065 TaxID=2970925 RepID=UPI002264CFD3|nr:NAD-dependent epimerase/dehydratase family protein [Sphingobium sp. JS3065]UZW57235.1 NAD-dependent epimerase/dehydratase family protein [Sphingobium sp. JS3065]